LVDTLLCAFPSDEDEDDHPDHVGSKGTSEYLQGRNGRTQRKRVNKYMGEVNLTLMQLQPSAMDHSAAGRTFELTESLHAAVA
jgi:hypothetical protein